MDRRHRLLVIAAFAVLYLVWGSTYLAIRIGLESMPPLLMAGWRFALAGGVLYAWCRWRGEPRPMRLEWRNAAIVGFCLMAGGNGLVTWCQQWVPSSIAALLVAMMPLSMTLLSSLFFGGQRPGILVIGGIALGIFGVGLLVRPEGTVVGGVDPLGAALLVLATLFWAWGSLFSRSAALPRSPFLAAGMEMLAGGGLLIALGSIAGEWPRVALSSMSLASIGAVIYLVVFGSILALSAYVWLLRVCSATAVSTYAFVNPVIAVLLGWAIAGEHLDGRVAFATLLIVASVGAILWARRRGLPAGQPAMTSEPGLNAESTADGASATLAADQIAKATR